MTRSGVGQHQGRRLPHLVDHGLASLQFAGPGHQGREPDELQRRSNGQVGLIDVRANPNRATPERRNDESLYAMLKARYPLSQFGIAGSSGPNAGSGQVGTTADSTGGDLEKAGHALQGGGTLGQATPNPFLQGGRFGLQGCDQQILFASKATVEGAQRHARVGGHVPQADGLETASLGQFDGRIYDSLGSLFHGGRY